MAERVKKHGKERSYFMLSLQNIWIDSEAYDIMSSGDEISTVLTMRSILLVRRKMLVKSDFILLSEHGSMAERLIVGMIYFDFVILKQKRYTPGGMSSHVLVREMSDGGSMLGGGAIV